MSQIVALASLPQRSRVVFIVMASSSFVFSSNDFENENLFQMFAVSGTRQLRLGDALFVDQKRNVTRCRVDGSSNKNSAWRLPSGSRGSRGAPRPCERGCARPRGSRRSPRCPGHWGRARGCGIDCRRNCGDRWWESASPDGRPRSLEPTRSVCDMRRRWLGRCYDPRLNCFRIQYGGSPRRLAAYPRRPADRRRGNSGMRRCCARLRAAKGA